ncbi:MAG: radical SAM protein [Planctomycetota bacterium]
MEKTKEIWFFAPSIKHFDTEEFSNRPLPHFVPVSITGKACSLNCKHCERQILQTMFPATTPEQLIELAKNLKKRGCKGVLLSGGADKCGVVPLAKFTSAMSVLKKELGLLVTVHTGIVTEELAASLAEAGVDCAMLDIIGADETVREIYSLDVSAEIYRQSISNVVKHGVSAAPHIVIGLHYGRIIGEKKAIDFASEFQLASLVLVVLMPLQGTSMENIRVSSPQKVAEIIEYARKKIPHAPLLLGCARPSGKEKEILDKLAIDIGVDGIAYPADGTVAYAKQKGFIPRFSELCCSLIFLGPKASHL